MLHEPATFLNTGLTGCYFPVSFPKSYRTVFIKHLRTAASVGPCFILITLQDVWFVLLPFVWFAFYILFFVFQGQVQEIRTLPTIYIYIYTHTRIYVYIYIYIYIELTTIYIHKYHLNKMNKYKVMLDK